MTSSGAAEATTDRPQASEPCSSAETLDVALMCVGAIAAVLVGTQIGRLGHRAREGAPWHLTTARINPLLVGLAVAALVLVAFLLWRRKRALGGEQTDALLTPWQVGSHLRLWLTFLSFMLGVVVGVGIRLYLGSISVTDFFVGATPLIAGLVVGIVFSQANVSDIDRVAYRQRQLGVIFVLVGAIAGAAGSTPGEGWMYGSCFLLVWGSLAASCYVVMNLIFGTDE
jgi:F0F1-type ATP synthase assembly protein I